MNTKTEIQKRMKEMRDTGMSDIAISRALNREGARTPKGRSWSSANVYQYRTARSLSKEVGNDFLDTIITHPGLSPHQKVKLIRAYMGSASDAV